MKKIEGMNIKQKLTYGYTLVIMFMIVSGIFSMMGLATLYASQNDFVNGSNRADTAVKVCRINVNIAARNIREMALNEDISSYDEYEQKVVERLTEVSTELQALKATGLIDESLYQKYSDSLNVWGEIGYNIIGVIKAGEHDRAVELILTECTPALDEVIAISQEIDAVTDELMDKSVLAGLVTFIVSVIIIILFVIGAVIVSKKLGKRIVDSITEPLMEIEEVAKELTQGNLHSTLEYHSKDEIGALAHSLRKSIRILGSYVDDISRVMEEFSKGNFGAKPVVEWHGDFSGIENAFNTFEKSMSETIKGIQNVANQVKNGSEQVSMSSMDLAQGATEQASITQELAATIETVSNQVSQNAQSAKDISKKVEDVGVQIVTSNEKMQEMMQSMSEINNASQEISKIIATINDIASQTNLLALNASIEAARAGEAGKGFAVVADQVSILASQSANAAKESTALIESSVRAVEKGMVIADETASQLEDAVTGSKVITEDVNAVAMELDTQMASFEQINSGVEHINDVVQTNSATSQQCAAASQEMSCQATSLENLVSQFKIG